MHIIQFINEHKNHFYDVKLNCLLLNVILFTKNLFIFAMQTFVIKTRIEMIYLNQG